MLENKLRLEVGNWVKGRTQNGELVIGYIEEINVLRNIDVIEVMVITSDNNEIVGQTIKMLDIWLEYLPVSSEKSEGQLLSLIDLALLTRDEEWFKELSSELNSLPAKVN